MVLPEAGPGTWAAVVWIGYCWACEFPASIARAVPITQALIVRCFMPRFMGMLLEDERSLQAFSLVLCPLDNG
ncbi:hypothetical protein D9M71_476490 [compost metagenome]